MIVSNFEITSGMQGWVNALLIAPTPILFLAGFAVSAILRRTRPQTWEELGRADQERQAHGSDAAPATLRR